MGKRPPKLGHVNFRLDSSLHEEMLQVARVLGTDLSGLLKMMIARTMPAFRKRAAEITAENTDAAKLLTETVDALLAMARRAEGG